MNALAPHIEKVLQRIAAGKANTRADSLLAAVAGDAEHLAEALWALVREGKGALVGQERPVVAMLTLGTFDADDFMSLLRQLKGANLFWFEGWKDAVDGLAYHGWSKELEVMLDELLQTATDRTPLEWADVSEPAGSSLLFALGRRGIVEAHALPPDALHRFARAFLWRGDWCEEQFAGWERLWSAATFGKATMACVNDIKNAGVFPESIASLVEYATPTQLAVLVDKMVWADSRTITWLAARGKAIVPQLEVRVEELLRAAKKGVWPDDDTGWHVAALARIRAQKNETWPTAWLPLAKAMLKHDAPGVRDVLAIVDPKIREDLLVEHLADEDHWGNELWPLTLFPTPRVVDKLVQLIRTTPTEHDWHDERKPLFETLGKMGPLGQAALEQLLDEPRQTEHVLANLQPTLENLEKILPYLSSPQYQIHDNAEKCWYAAGNDERIAAIDRHFDALRPAFVARLLGHTQFHPRTRELAARLADTDETHKWREFCLHPPEVLRGVMAEMAATPQEAIERARKALADVFVDPDDEDDDVEDDDEDLADKLRAFGPRDLAAILHVTACRLETRREAAWHLCRHFWPARPEIPWIAVFWWGIDCGSNIQAATDVVGEAIVPALHARAHSGTLSQMEWHDVLPIFTKFDPVGGFRYCTPFAELMLMRLTVKDMVIAAIEKGSSEAREWLAQALSTKAREFALTFLSEYPVPEVLPALQALENQKLNAKARKLLPRALEAQKTLGASLVRTHKALSARLFHRVDGPIESLRLSTDGRTMAAYAAEKVTVWQETHEAVIGNLGKAFVELSLDGRFVLVMNESDVRVFEPWENVEKPRQILKPGPGLSMVVPMPGGRAFTLCPAHDAAGPLTLWDLETGAKHGHKLIGLPAHVVWLDDKHYVVATTDEKIAIREFDGGKTTDKLQTWGSCGGVAALASGHGGKLVATVFFDGSLMIFDISGPKIKAIGRHLRAAPQALATDPFSFWVVTPGTDEVLTWKEGQPARSLPGSGPVSVRRAEQFANTGLAVFLRPNVVAVGGQSVDVWDLEAGQHLGRWDKPVTALISAFGKLFVGDVEGNIWEVDGG